MRNLPALFLCLHWCGCIATPWKPAAVQPPLASSAPTRLILCVVEDHRLRDIDAAVDPATGDTLVHGRRFSEVYPSTAPPYAMHMSWYQNHDGDFIQLGSDYFIRYGRPRSISAAALARVGSLQGVPIFAERAALPRIDMIYLPVRPGCTFQPYQWRCVDTSPPPPGAIRIDCGALPRPALQATATLR